MRKLEDEVLYLRKEGFHRNTVELTVMLSWLGEQRAIEAERDAAVTRADKAVDRAQRMANLVVRCKRVFDGEQPDSTLLGDLMRAFNDAQRPS